MENELKDSVLLSTVNAIIQTNKDTRYFICFRNDRQENRTIGKLYLSDNINEMFCYTLEDAERDEKIDRVTAIPVNFDGYDVDIVNSPRFGEVVTLYTEKKGELYILDHSGLRFTQIRVHGGNDEEDTEGCPLVARYRSGNKIQGSMKNEVVQVAKNWKSEGYFVKWIVV